MTQLQSRGLLKSESENKYTTQTTVNRYRRLTTAIKIRKNPVKKAHKKKTLMYFTGPQTPQHFQLRYLPE